jgi:hypothetical protein
VAREEHHHARREIWCDAECEDGPAGERAATDQVVEAEQGRAGTLDVLRQHLRIRQGHGPVEYELRGGDAAGGPNGATDEVSESHEGQFTMNSAQFTVDSVL